MVFKNFESTDIVAGRIQPVSTGVWAGGVPQWTGGFHTSVYQAETTHVSSALSPANGLYYTNIYDGPTGSASSEVYFSVTYGNAYGSGSLSGNSGSLVFPTKAIYNQYKNVVLTPGDTLFSFEKTTAGQKVTEDSAEIYVLNFKTAKFKDRIDNGQFEITLAGKDASNNSITRTFIDDSLVPQQQDQVQSTKGKRYSLIRGDLTNGPTVISGGAAVYDAIGALYPDLGIVVFNATALNAAFPGGSPTGKKFIAQFVEGSTTQQTALVEAIVNGNKIAARCTEYVPSRHYFVRVKNQECNYSNNPTYILSAEEAQTQQDVGKIRFSEFYQDPKVYVTTIGLYTPDNDLVAVAKLSKPVLKDFTTELLVRVRLDW